MLQVTALLPDDLGAELDAAGQRLNRCRADIILQAIEYYLKGSKALRCGVADLGLLRCSLRMLALKARLRAVLSDRRPPHTAQINQPREPTAASPLTTKTADHITLIN